MSSRSIPVRTIYGSAILTSRSMGLNHDIPGDYSALHYGGIPVAGHGALNTGAIVPNLPASLIRGMETAPEYDADNDTDNLKVAFYCIGNRGHRYVAGGGTAPAVTEPVPHRATDSGLYGWIPFLIRPFADDITGATRAKYRLRRTLDIGGQIYVAYYGKVMDFTGVTPETSLVTIDGGIATPSPFTPTINSLQPDPSLVTNLVITDNNGSYTSVAAVLNIPFSATDVSELMSAMDILFGNPNYAVVSEIAICSGVDKLCDTRYSNVTPFPASAIVASQPTEAVGVQVVNHISTHYPMVFLSTGVTMTFNLGAVEPLFGVGST